MAGPACQGERKLPVFPGEQLVALHNELPHLVGGGLVWLECPAASGVAITSSLLIRAVPGLSESGMAS